MLLVSGRFAAGAGAACTLSRSGAPHLALVAQVEDGPQQLLLPLGEVSVGAAARHAGRTPWRGQLKARPGMPHGGERLPWRWGQGAQRCLDTHGTGKDRACRASPQLLLSAAPRFVHDQGSGHCSPGIHGRGGGTATAARL